MAMAMMVMIYFATVDCYFHNDDDDDSGFGQKKVGAKKALIGFHKKS